ncbi:MAG: hypothetical protein ACM30G_04980 [Micromonosporaceae bacterium]
MLTRVERNHATTLTHTFYVGETPTDPTGTPTYAVVDANGTSVTSGNATVVGASSGQVTAALAAQSALKALTITWVAIVGGVSRTEVDYAEVVGGFYFGLAEGRGSDAALANTTTYPTSAVELRRLETEVECDYICDRAFVPRYRRLVLDGSGTTELVLADADLRTIRRIAVADRLDETFTDLGSAALAAVAIGTDRTIRRTDGNVFTEGRRNVIVEYEFGLDAPPPDLVWATKTRLRTRLTMPTSAIPDRAQSFVVAEGGTFRLTMPGAFATGIPEVDAVYGRYSLREGVGGDGGRPVPASRTLDYTPQRWSMFHGAR